MAAHTLQQHNQVPKQIFNQAVAITPPNTASPQYLYNLPPVVFTITDFLEKKQANKVWTSPPYNTHTRGYKFCLKVYISQWWWKWQRYPHINIMHQGIGWQTTWEKQEVQSEDISQLEFHRTPTLCAQNALLHRGSLRWAVTCCIMHIMRCGILYYNIPWPTLMEQAWIAQSVQLAGRTLGNHFGGV